MEKKGRKVLIVDDDPTIIKMIKIFFENSGLKTIVASSGYEAMKLYEEEKPDAMILDIRMPKIDGQKVLKKIRIEKKDLKTPVIAITGFHSAKVKSEIMAAGANAYLEKPLDMVKLLRIVKELMK